MKILWYSDSPTAPTGFGNVTRFVCSGLADYGHDVAILSWQARGQPTHWQNCTLYSMRSDNGVTNTVEVLLEYMRQLQPDVLITLADVWWSDYMTSPTLMQFLHTAGIPWAHYYPIDSDLGDGRLPESWMRILKTIDLPIAMSRYGYDITRASGVTPAYIPHGVDTSIFRPPANKLLAKQALGYEGHFVVLCDARNQRRKMLPRTLDIFRRFAAGKDDVILHLHCDPNDPVAHTSLYSYDLQADIAFLNLTNKVRITPNISVSKGGLPITELAQIYQAADLHLLASWGEGFGLPTLQAAASGVVPMACDYSASRELVLDHGEAISVRHFVQDEFGLRRALIDIDDAINRLERLYMDRALLTAKAERARSFAESYDWQHIIPQWHELLSREVPRVRADLIAQTGTLRITRHSDGTNASSDPAHIAPRYTSPLLKKVRTFFSGRVHKADGVAIESAQEMQQDRPPLTLPVTLPLPESRQARARIMGCIYAASKYDVPIVQVLSAIFPNLKVWSTTPLDLGHHPKSGQPIQVEVAQANSAEYQSRLAASTLGLDMGGIDPLLPVRAVELSVPCIGLSRCVEQLWLWTELSLEDADIPTAAELGRWMLTDQGAATHICAQALRRYKSTSPISANLL